MSERGARTGASSGEHSSGAPQEGERAPGELARIEHAGSVRGERHPRVHRLRRREDFLRVQRDGVRVHTRHFVVVILPRSDGDGAVGDGARRLGITVTKKVANAVGRNRVKRVVRELFRRNHALFPDGCDVVVIAKSQAPEVGYPDAVAELTRVRGPMAAAARRARKARAR